LYDHAVAVADGRIFVVCGLDDANAAQDLVFFTGVDPANGDIGVWKQEAHKYPMKVGRNAAVGYQVGSDWYILGVGGQVVGYTTRKRECYYAKLNTTSCAAPTVTAIAPPNGRQDNAACHVTIEGTNSSLIPWMRWRPTLVPVRSVGELAGSSGCTAASIRWPGMGTA